ncbi:hypothetical protein BJV74DRAFT_953125, partial [Russula compacta]
MRVHQSYRNTQRTQYRNYGPQRSFRSTRTLTTNACRFPSRYPPMGPVHYVRSPAFIPGPGCSALSPTLSTFETIQVVDPGLLPQIVGWEDDMQWLEIFHPFTSVKNLYLL